MANLLYYTACFLASLIFSSGDVNAQQSGWTHFRGSRSTAVAENQEIPLTWNDSVIIWKTALHDRGHSSPVVYGNQIWLTTATADGKALYALCIDFRTGAVIYDIEVFTSAETEEKHSFNTYATPTPCIEKDYVYVHYGNAGTACISTSTGSVVWKNSGYRCKFVQGSASSPVIYKDLLILHYEGVDVRFIVALDKTDGRQIWKTFRPEEPYKPLTEIGRKAYSTPIIINVKGRDMMISNGSALCMAYDPLTGKEIWRVVDGAESVIAMPVTENGTVYWYTGWMGDIDQPKYADLLAVNPDGSGDITGTNIIWKKKEGIAQNQMLTPVVKDGLLYTLTTRNMMMCIDALTGREVWSEHVTSGYNASPLWIGGNVWFFSVKGEAVTIKAGRDYKVVARNKLDSGIWATPAVVRNSLILRTEKYLYRIGEK